MKFQYNDGGRQASGRKGLTGDCVCRAIAIASGRSYEEVYDRLAEGNATQRRSKHDVKRRSRSASRGICVKRQWFKDYMHELGFRWIPTMQIGQGCKVHLSADELPKGRLVVAVSKHYCAVIDGVLHDTYEDTREGTRCVYGYWILEKDKDMDSEESMIQTRVVGDTNWQRTYQGITHVEAAKRLGEQILLEVQPDVIDLLCDGQVCYKVETKFKDCDTVYEHIVNFNITTDVMALRKDNE
jgi:hypothetical protein